MVINKVNMIDALQKLIEIEKNNRNDVPMNMNEKDAEIYKMGYVKALKNLLFAVTVNGE